MQTFCCLISEKWESRKAYQRRYIQKRKRLHFPKRSASCAKHKTPPSKVAAKPSEFPMALFVYGASRLALFCSIKNGSKTVKNGWKD